MLALIAAPSLAKELINFITTLLRTSLRIEELSSTLLRLILYNIMERVNA